MIYFSTYNTLRPKSAALTALIFISLLTPSLAFAHAEVGVAGGLVSGLLHPILGPDHLVAMVAVGLWGAQLGMPAIYLLPIVFPIVMAVGGLLGIAGVPLPFVELGIALSALMLGLAVAFQFKAGLIITSITVGFFAIFHGHAHGTELPEAANAMAYGIGFVVATGLLHLAGILIGVLVRWPGGAIAVRSCGAMIAMIGVYYIAAASGSFA